MLTISWSHSHRVQCGALSEAGAEAPPANQARASRYLSELNGSPPLPSNAPNTRLMSGRGPPQQGMILPPASMIMFLYNQWQVWPDAGAGSPAAAWLHGFANASAIAALATLSGNGFQFSGGLEMASQFNRRTPPFTSAGRISGSSHLTSNGFTTRNKSTPSFPAMRAAMGISCALCSNARKFQDSTGVRLPSLRLASTSFRTLLKTSSRSPLRRKRS